jgi:hypothetical protein
MTVVRHYFQIAWERQCMQRCLMTPHRSSLYFTNLQALLKEKSREILGFFTQDDQKLILDKRLGTSK